MPKNNRKINKTIKRNLNKTINKTKNKNIEQKVLKGGRYLGEGAFGCVITPALQCSRKSRKYSYTQKRYSISRRSNQVGCLSLQEITTQFP